MADVGHPPQHHVHADQSAQGPRQGGRDQPVTEEREVAEGIGQVMHQPASRERGAGAVASLSSGAALPPCSCPSGPWVWGGTVSPKWAGATSGWAARSCSSRYAEGASPIRSIPSCSTTSISAPYSSRRT